MEISVSVKTLSAIFDRVADGTVKAYWIMRDGKKYAMVHDREVAENIAAALSGTVDIVESEVKTR